RHLASRRRLPRGRTARAPDAQVAQPALRGGPRRVPVPPRPGRGHRGHEPGRRPVDRAVGCLRQGRRSARSRAQRVVEVSQGEVWWADLPAPAGSAPGFRRPVLVVQGEPLNRSRIATVVCVPLTSNLTWAQAPGNVLLPAKATDLPKESVANASQIIAVDRAFLTERVTKLGP